MAVKPQPKSAPPADAGAAVDETHCLSCDQARSAQAKFCPHCGVDLRTPMPQEAVEPRAAAAPRSSVPVVDGGADEKPPAPPIPAPAAACSPSSSPQDGPTPKPPACACGRALRGDDRFCSGCGAPVSPSAGAGLWLTGTDGQGRVIAIPLDRRPIVIGKDTQCDVVLEYDPYVSRRHARMTHDNDLIYVEDLASANGTLLRIQRPIVIEAGDQIILGTTILRLEHRGK